MRFLCLINCYENNDLLFIFIKIDMNKFYLHHLTGPSALLGMHPAPLKSWQLGHQWMWEIKKVKNFLPLLTHLEMTCLSHSTRETRDSETQSLWRLTTIPPPSGCLLRLSACAHFTSERKWWRRRLKCGHSQRLERLWKKRYVLIIIMTIFNPFTTSRFLQKTALNTRCFWYCLPRLRTLL